MPSLRSSDQYHYSSKNWFYTGILSGRISYCLPTALRTNETKLPKGAKTLPSAIRAARIIRHHFVNDIYQSFGNNLSATAERETLKLCNPQRTMEQNVEASRKRATNFDWPLWVSRWDSL